MHPIDLTKVSEPFQVEEPVSKKKEGEVRVQFRWGEEQLQLVKLAAKKIGIPYQTYVKQTLYQQAIRDVRTALDQDGTVQK